MLSNYKGQHPDLYSVFNVIQAITSSQRSQMTKNTAQNIAAHAILVGFCRAIFSKIIFCFFDVQMYSIIFAQCPKKIMTALYPRETSLKCF